MNNVLKFYMFNNKLKKILRQGWLDVKISGDRIESIAEHIYGCLILSITINDEFKLKLNMEHILKMLTLHELEEIIIGDLSALSKVTKEEKLEMGKKAVKKITNGLINQSEIESLLNEFNERVTKEAKFAYHIDKLEPDFQAKIYDLEGKFNIEDEIKDCKAWCGNDANEIIEKAKCASDIWLDVDKYLYEDDELFAQIQAAIKNITKEEYDFIFKELED